MKIFKRLFNSIRNKNKKDKITIMIDTGLSTNTDCICNTGVSGFCFKHRTEWL